MRPKATIYKSGKSPSKGELVLELSLILKIVYRILRISGLFLIAISIISMARIFIPIFSLEINYSIQPKQNKIDYSRQIVDSQSVLAIKKEAESYSVSTYFSIVVPKIQAHSNIIPNVDVSNPKEYLSALSEGVAHAKGTNFPGQAGRIFLFSHSTDSPVNFARFNAIFYLLKKLDPGDQIIVYFSDKRYVYSVEKLVITSPSDTSWIAPKTGEEELVLMTCDPPGTTWNRLLIIAKPINS
jgi:LPXTG-site transpeptidase (sortase) family protein